MVVNACAYRATDSRRLMSVADPCVPRNRAAWLACAARATLIVGAHGLLPGQLKVAPTRRSHQPTPGSEASEWSSPHCAIGQLLSFGIEGREAFEVLARLAEFGTRLQRRMTSSRSRVSRFRRITGWVVVGAKLNPAAGRSLVAVCPGARLQRCAACQNAFSSGRTPS